MEQVAEGTYRLGTRWVNFYIVAERDGLTLVDTGVRGYLPQIEYALQELGRTSADVKAIVLTHTHSDHIGCTDSLAETTSAPVFVHREEAPIATGEKKPSTPQGFFGSMWRPTMLSFTGHFIANKGLTHITVPEVTSYDDGEVLDIPGKPRVAFCPGHSSGHSALLLESHDAVFCGDALATLAVNTGETGPMVHPFNEDREGAIASLAVLESLSAGLVLPGHGEPWKGTPAEAVVAARARL